MKPANFILTFKDLEAPQDKTSVEFLPCQFQSNIDTCHRDIYFDPITKPLPNDSKPHII